MSILSYLMCDCEHLDCDTMCDFSEFCNHKETAMEQSYDEWKSESNEDIHNSKILLSDEKLALVKTIELWDAIAHLDGHHPDELNEYRFHIHAIQNAIAARQVFKEINK